MAEPKAPARQPNLCQRRMDHLDDGSILLPSIKSLVVVLRLCSVSPAATNVYAIETLVLS